MKKDTGWGEEAVVGYYQKEVILPNLHRLVAPEKDEVILDLGCGEGFFAKKFARSGAEIIGVDVSKKLIAAAQRTAGKNEKYHVGSAADLAFIRNSSVDKILFILSLQNMDNAHLVLKECHRVLKPEGRMFFVLNHPAFRVPKASGWGYDEGMKTQYRRVDAYLSESKVKIAMHPGDQPNAYTLTFHRPLQVYFKLLKNSGFAVTNLEEWISPKASEPGPRAKAENAARKEIPLFLFLEAAKI